MQDEIARLPIHGFVLAGGQSSRMGRDKAMLLLQGRPLVEIAIARLRSFCTNVSIAGNRDDLAGFATVVPETRHGIGPAAGIEAGLMRATHAWALFIPVDVPMVPASLLQTWAAAVLELEKAGCAASFLLVEKERQPAFCMIRRDCRATVTSAIEAGEQRIWGLLAAVDQADSEGWLWAATAEEFAPRTGEQAAIKRWFLNLNTPADALEAELWSKAISYPEDL